MLKSVKNLIKKKINKGKIGLITSVKLIGKIGILINNEIFKFYNPINKKSVKNFIN